MHPFSLSAVKEVDLAIRAHARDPDTAFIAGGTDLVGLMKDRVVLPKHLVDINHLPGLDQIEVLPDGGFRMGALVRMSDVAVNMHVRKSAPMVARVGRCSAASRFWRCSRIVR